MGDDYVAVVDWRTHQVVKKIVTGKGAHQFMLMPDQKTVLVTNRVANTVSSAPAGVSAVKLTSGGRKT